MIYLAAISLIVGTLAAGLGFSYYMDFIPGTQIEEKKEPTLVIEALTAQGNPLSMYVIVGNESGYTPFKFYGSGVQNVTISNYETFIFSRWDDASGSLSRIVELNDNSSKTIRAIYQ